MKKYYRRRAESDLGFGTIYLEFDGEWVSRQAEQYGDRWFTSNSLETYHADIGPGLIDQPLSETDLTIEDEISREEFEQAWDHANKAGMSWG